MHSIVSRTPGFFAKTALAVALSAALWTSAAPAQWSQQNEQTYLNAFFNNNYTYCDAMAMAVVWSGNESDAAVYDAKLQAGWKITGGQNPWSDYIQPKLSAIWSAPARPYSFGFLNCYYGDSGYGYSHAATLACFWQKPIEDTKLYMGVMQGLRQDIAAKLQMAHQNGC